MQFLHSKLQSISPVDLATTAAAAAAVTTVDPQALLQQKGAQSNLVALRTRNNENWGESSMADTSPRTDTSTDPDIDIDEGNQMVPTILSSTLCHSVSL
jgi:transcription factor TGA